MAKESPAFDRRHLLRGSATLTAGLALSGLGLSAVALGGCGGDSDEAAGSTSSPPGGGVSPPTSQAPAPTTSAAQNGDSPLPNYVHFDKVKPDIPGTPEGVLDAYFTYPRPPVVGSANPPGKGVPAPKILVSTFNPVPPGLNKNLYWQELNKRVGCDLDISLVPNADLLDKLATLLAGNDLPEIVQLPFSTPNLASTLANVFEDLTPHLAGSAIEEYPFLANIPTASWRQMTYGGSLYGLPTPRASIGSIMFCRDDLLKARDVDPHPATWDDFLAACRELVDIKNSHWPLPNARDMVLFLQQIEGAPNGWSEQDGEFTSTNETDATRRAISTVASMVKEGLFHPDTFTAPFTQTRTWLANGTVYFNYDGYAAWDIYTKTYKVGVDGVPVPAKDANTKPRQFTGTASYSMTALKKSDPTRIGQLLKVCDWLAAPFGTAEFLFLKFGSEGVHFTWQDGLPVLTPRGQTEVQLSLQYVVDAPTVLGPDPQELVERQRAYEAKIVPVLVPNPTVGLYAPSVGSGDDTKANTALSNIKDDVLSGRKSISAWDSAVASWKKSIGDKIRGEYEAAYAEIH